MDRFPEDLRFPLLSMVALLGLWGCPQAIEVADGGGGTDGPVVEADLGALGDLGPGVDLGAPTDGGGVDGGQGDAQPGQDLGVEPSIRVTRLLLPAQGSDGALSVHVALGTQRVVYVGTQSGNVFRSVDGGPFAVVWHEPGNASIIRIRAVGSTIFTATRGGLWVHPQGYEEAGSSFPVGRQVYDLEVISLSEAYLVSDQNNGRGLYRYNGQGIETVVEPMDVSSLLGLAADSRGRVLVSAYGKIFMLDGQAWTEEVIDWPDNITASQRASTRFNDVLWRGDRAFAVGSGHLVLERQPQTGIWSFARLPQGSEELSALAGEGTGFFAVGAASGEGAVFSYSMGVLRSIGGADFRLHDIWAVGPEEFYAVGTVRNQFESVLLRGSKP